MTYTRAEVEKASLVWFNGDSLASDVFTSKYALHDNEEHFLELTPSDMFRRLAREFARIEAEYVNPLTFDEIYSLFSGFDPITGLESFGDVVAQGSPMAGIGNVFQLQSLSNCFVIPSAFDSYNGILKTDLEQCNIMKRRGGAGHDVSSIRPAGFVTMNAARTSAGVGSFMERFSNSTREVGQGGRRGALMLTISVRHPDILTFVNIKRDKTKVTGANISVRLEDDFMLAVENDEDYVLRWPVEATPSEARVTKTVKARDVWRQIIMGAHDNAEPGVLFWSNFLKYGPADVYPEFRSISTNPCAELCLSAYDSCRLMLTNVNRFVKNRFRPDAYFDFQRFDDVTQKAQRLMDDLVDLEIECVDKIIAKVKNDPEPEAVKQPEIELWENIKKSAVRGRRTGLGVTGLGDALASLGVKYGSDQSVEVVESIYRAHQLAAFRSTVKMAEERGSFPAYDHSIEKGHVFLERVLALDPALREAYEKYGRRNIALTTTAPAGSVSIMTQTTSGCEPVYQAAYIRRKKINPGDTTAPDFTDALGDAWKHFTVYHHGLRQWMSITGEEDVTKSPYHGAESKDVDWRRRVELQAAAQKWICHSISSTINLHKDTTPETVADIYMLGWKSGCKGLTIYRDGCRDGVLVSENKKPEQPSGVVSIIDTTAPKRPRELKCDIHHAKIKGEKYVVLVGLLDGRPYEVFAGLSDNIEIPKKIKSGTLIKNGKNSDGVSTYNLQLPIDDVDVLVIRDVVEQFKNEVYGAFTRTISTALRHGTPVHFLADQLRKDKHSDITSFSSVIARVLSKNYASELVIGQKCDSCGSTNMKRENGCLSCVDCGWSKCS